MRNDNKKKERDGGEGGERGWQENVRFYIHTAIMYNKYIHMYMKYFFQQR